MVDIADLLARIDLRALAEEAGADFGNSNSSACPIHHGTKPTSFHVYRGKNGLPLWHCFTGCQTGGDALRFMQMWQHLDFVAAIAELQRRAGAAPLAPADPRPPAPALRTAVSPAPGHDWQDRCVRFLCYCQDQLWQNDAVLAYLSNRGLQPETIGAWGLGWNPRDIWDDETRYGLADGKKLWLARGLVIPGWRNDALWYVKIRRPIGEDMERFGLAIAGQVSLPKMKYAAIRGGSLTLFGESHLSAQRRPALVIAEGELDAILLSQVAGDLVDVLTLGGASMHVSMDDLLILAAYPRIIAAHDNDDAGAKARARLAALSERIIVAPPPAHDITAAWQLYGASAIRHWITEALNPAPQIAAPPPPPPASRVIIERYHLNDPAAGWQPIGAA